MPKKNKKKQNHFLVPGMSVIQHRNWPLRSTILNAHGTNASPDGLCTRTHTNEAFSCWFCCNSFRVDRARRGNVCLEACLGRRRCSIVLSASSPLSAFLLLLLLLLLLVVLLPSVRIHNFLFHFPFDEIYRRLIFFTLGRSVSA